MPKLIPTEQRRQAICLTMRPDILTMIDKLATEGSPRTSRSAVVEMAILTYIELSKYEVKE